MSKLMEGGDGFISSLISGNFLIACGIIGAIFLLDFLVTPRLDPNEPPLLKPQVPLIGHIIGIIWHQFNYHDIIYKKHQIPIASLQMLWGKLYTIYDPYLAQASLRARTLSFEPFIVEFAEKTFGLDQKTFAKIKYNPKLVPDFTEAIHANMQPTFVHAMNINALQYISDLLEQIRPGDDAGLNCPNMFEWVKDLITSASISALLGSHSPFAEDPTLYNDLWNFETGLANLLTRPFPSITCRKAYLSRNRLQHALGLYYAARHDVNDPSVAQLTRGRANSLRAHGFSGHEIGQIEVMLPIVGSANTVPIMYWMLCHIFAKPDLVHQLRNEVLPYARKSEDDDSAVTINIAKLESECPLLVSCYRETLRIANFNVSSRRILEDTTIQDSHGRSYKLKKGVDVQIAGIVMHRDHNNWGADAMEFKPERFMTAVEKTVEQAGKERTKKNAYLPFGGGRHLCPGRNFAFAEILAITSALIIGFELKSVGMTFDEMTFAPAVLGNATYKAKGNGEGLGLKIRRRKGWEYAKWNFEA